MKGSGTGLSALQASGVDVSLNNLGTRKASAAGALPEEIKENEDEESRTTE